MKLTELISILDVSFASPLLEDFQINGISCNSKKVLNDFVFVAIEGAEEDGHRFIQEAVKKGARAVIVQDSYFSRQQNKSQLPKEITTIVVNDSRMALAKIAREFFGDPSRQIKVVGITGTNGKTTISYLIEAILKEAGFSPAVIGTIEYRFKDKAVPSLNTTPGPLEIQSILSGMLKDGADYVAMEVSSHALDQGRTEGLNFHSAIFTNITQDHLDYHKTKEDYFQAKAKLFRNLNSHSYAIINNDDRYASRLKKMTLVDKVTYAIKGQADVFAQNIKFDARHTEFLLICRQANMLFKSNLIGCYNVYNILAAVAWAQRQGIDLPIIKSAIEKFYWVPGRLQRIDNDKGFLVFVDYAHTEDALNNVIMALRQLAPNKIIVVFGCGGQRDKTKRPKMGYAVTELADFAIITNDNPRQEDPEQIIEDIKKGIRKNNYSVITDRREAIKRALFLAKKGDIILAAGKGHENYQILKDETVPFDDCKIIRECLKLVS